MFCSDALYNVFIYNYIARGTLFDHVKSVYEGLITIRSFQSEGAVIKQFDEHQVLIFFLIS